MKILYGLILAAVLSLSLITDCQARNRDRRYYHRRGYEYPYYYRTYPKYYHHYWRNYRPYYCPGPYRYYTPYCYGPGIEVIVR